MPSPSRGNNFMLFLIVFGTIASIAVSIVLEIIGGYVHWTMPSVFGNAFFQMVNFFLPCLIYFLVIDHPLHDILPFKMISAINILLIFLMVVCIMPLSMLIGSITSLFAGNEVTAYFLEMYDQPFIFLVLSVCVSPAIFEEIALRGVVFSNHKPLGIKKAAFMNGLFFGIMHLQLEQFFYTFLLGAIFACMVYYTKSILASMFAHFCYNFLQTQMSYSSYQSSIESGITVEEMLETPPLAEQLAGMVTLAVVAVIFTFVFAVLFYCFVQYNKRRNIIEQMEEEMEMSFLASDEDVTDENVTDAALTANEMPKTKMITWSFWVLLVVYVIITVSVSLLSRL